jgi:CheY-like chemotaxis protein
MAPVLIFVVEDEYFVRDDLKSALEEGGYGVAEAKSGEEAVAMLDAPDATYAALVTDVNLAPGKLTGWDVARRARELVPLLPVVYTTAASVEEWGSMGVPNSILIHKPYAVAQVLIAVSHLLNLATSLPAVEN